MLLWRTAAIIGKTPLLLLVYCVVPTRDRSDEKNLRLILVGGSLSPETLDRPSS